MPRKGIFAANLANEHEFKTEQRILSLSAERIFILGHNNVVVKGLLSHPRTTEWFVKMNVTLPTTSSVRARII